MASRRVQTKTDIGDTKCGEGPGDFGLDPADGIDGGHRIPSHVFGAGGQRKCQGIKDEVGGIQPVARGGDGVDSMGDLHLPFQIAGLSTFVDQQTDHGCPVLTGQSHDPVQSAPGGFAVFEVGRVEDRSSTNVDQCGFHDFRFGGVNDQGGACRGGKPLRDFVHIGGPVAAYIIHAHIEDVSPLPDLLIGHLGTGVPISGQHRVTKGPRTVGIGALANDQKTVVLGDGNRGVDAGDRWFEQSGSWAWSEIFDRLHNHSKMFWGGPATSANDADPEVSHMMTMKLGKFWWRQVIVGPAIHHAREPGVGEHADGHRGMLRQVPQMFLHFGGPGRTVDTDHIRAHRCEGGQGRTNFGTHQHPPRGLHGDLDLNRDLSTLGCHCPSAADHGGLDLQQVHTGFD